MKTFQKIALVSAIAAAPFAAQAELTPMSEGLMAETTGQAGVTIEINLQDTGISIGEIEYTDTAHEVTDTNGVDPGDAGYVSTLADGGSVLIKGVTVSGWDEANQTASSVDIVQTIDVDANGTVNMTNSTTAGQQLRIQVAGIELQDNQTGSTNLNSELVNSLDLKLELGAESVTKIHNVDIQNQTLSDFGVTGDYATNTSGLVIEADAGIRIVDMDVSLFGYTTDQAPIVAQKTAIDSGYTADDTDSATGTTFESFDAVAAGGDGDGFIDQAEITNYGTYVAGKGAVEIKDLTFDDGAGGVVDVEQTIWADGSGVYIQLGSIAGNLNIGALEIGGQSIGSVAIRNMNLAGMTQKIYGH